MARTIKLFFLGLFMFSAIGCSGGFMADHYYDPTPRTGTYYGVDEYGRSYYERYRPYGRHHHYYGRNHYGYGGGGYSYEGRPLPPFMNPHGSGTGENMHRYLPPNPHSGYVPSEGFRRW